MTLCKHELEQAWCDLCKVVTYSGAHWDAKYDGPCAHAGCDGIKTGDRVRWTADGTAVQHSKHR